MKDTITKNDVLNAIRDNNSLAFNELIMRNASFCGSDKNLVDDRDVAHDELVFLVDLLDDPRLQQLPNPSPIWLRLESDWAALSEEQRSRVLNHIGRRYGEYGDWYTWFLMTVILGESVGNKDSFQIASRLKATSNQRARALLPHVFEHLARVDCLQSTSIKELMDGLHDYSESYRQECDLSLRRLKVLK